ncbi:MAG: hypothetical protein V1725_02705 [archaeon]
MKNYIAIATMPFLIVTAAYAGQDSTKATQYTPRESLVQTMPVPYMHPDSFQIHFPQLPQVQVTPAPEPENYQAPQKLEASMRKKAEEQNRQQFREFLKRKYR